MSQKEKTEKMAYHDVNEGFELSLDHALFEEFEFGSGLSSQIKNNGNLSESTGKKDVTNSSFSENISPQPKDGNRHDVAPLRAVGKQKKKRKKKINVEDVPVKKTPKLKKNKFVALVQKLRKDELPVGNRRLTWSEEEVAALIAGICKHHNSSTDNSKIKLWRTIKDDPGM